MTWEHFQEVVSQAGRVDPSHRLPLLGSPSVLAQAWLCDVGTVKRCRGDVVDHGVYILSPGAQRMRLE